jgi:hypothetical protein
MSIDRIAMIAIKRFILTNLTSRYSAAGHSFPLYELIIKHTGQVIKTFYSVFCVKSRQILLFARDRFEIPF